MGPWAVTVTFPGYARVEGARRGRRSGGGLDDAARAAHGERQRALPTAGRMWATTLKLAVERLVGLAKATVTAGRTASMKGRRRRLRLCVRHDCTRRSRPRVDAEAPVGAGRPARERAPAAVEEDAHAGRSRLQGTREERDLAVRRRGDAGQGDRLGPDVGVCLRGLAVRGRRRHRRRPHPGRVDVLHGRAVGGRSVPRSQSYAALSPEAVRVTVSGACPVAGVAVTVTAGGAASACGAATSASTTTRRTTGTAGHARKHAFR